MTFWSFSKAPNPPMMSQGCWMNGWLYTHAQRSLSPVRVFLFGKVHMDPPNSVRLPPPTPSIHSGRETNKDFIKDDGTVRKINHSLNLTTWQRGSAPALLSMYNYTLRAVTRMGAPGAGINPSTWGNKNGKKDLIIFLLFVPNATSSVFHSTYNYSTFPVIIHP